MSDINIDGLLIKMKDSTYYQGRFLLPKVCHFLGIVMMMMYVACACFTEMLTLMNDGDFTLCQNCGFEKIKI